MIGTIENFMQDVGRPISEMNEIGLRGCAALAQANCDAGERFCALQSGAMRAALNDYAQAAAKLGAGEPIGADPAVDAMRQAMSYWRSLTEQVGMTQAEWAEAMEEAFTNLTDVTRTTAERSATAGVANLPIAISSASGFSTFAAAQAMCGHWARSMRQFVDSVAGEADVGEDALERSETRLRTHRKAA